jgi:3-hydroxyisobutyrate dehydrogenase-like beta-hydroxyacid dehydrogenase
MTMQIGIVGLGRMGGNMARRLAAGGVDVVGFDPDVAARTALGEIDGCAAADDLESLVNALHAPRVLWLMVPAGEHTETTLAELAPRLLSEDVIVDGGNAFYKDSERRAVDLASYGIRFVDCGVSGGVWGREQGYALMFGGSAAAARAVDVETAIACRITEEGVNPAVRNPTQESSAKAMAVAAIAAVSARRMVLPRDADVQPLLEKTASSSSLQPPSGPHASSNSSAGEYAARASFRASWRSFSERARTMASAER